MSKQYWQPCFHLFSCATVFLLEFQTVVLNVFVSTLFHFSISCPIDSLINWFADSLINWLICLVSGLHLTRDNLKKAGVGALIDKIFGEVIEKLQEMQLDRAEWGCLRAVMLFSPGTVDNFFAVFNFSTKAFSYPWFLPIDFVLFP